MWPITTGSASQLTIKHHLRHPLRHVRSTLGFFPGKVRREDLLDRVQGRIGDGLGPKWVRGQLPEVLVQQRLLSLADLHGRHCLRENLLVRVFLWPWTIVLSPYRKAPPYYPAGRGELADRMVKESGEGRSSGI